MWPESLHHQGSLKAYTTGNPLGRLELGKFTVQLLLGLHALHSRSLMHQDLKAENVFLTATLDLKIGDFGSLTKCTPVARFVGGDCSLGPCPPPRSSG